MYVHRTILAKVKDLFLSDPPYRDNRWATIVLISRQIKDELTITDEIALVKVAFDVDRAFRYIQQHNPELRGETWLERQKQAGEIPSENDDLYDRLKKKQLNLF